MIHQIIPDDISFGYLDGDDDETIIKPPICLTTPTRSKPTASVWPIQPTLQSQPSQPDSQLTEEENTNPHPQVQPIDVILYQTSNLHHHHKTLLKSSQFLMMIPWKTF